MSFGKQRSNVSYGRSTSEDDAWRFLMLPTPGASNTIGYDGAVADTKFDFDRGFYDEPFDVTITCNTPGSAIYYTLDGSEPGSPTGRLPKGRALQRPDPHHDDHLSAGPGYQGRLAAQRMWTPKRISF